MFSSMMSIKHTFSYQKFSFSFRKNGYTVNPLYNVSVCSLWFVTLKWICCYKESAVMDHKMSIHVYLEDIDMQLEVIFIANTSN